MARAAVASARKDALMARAEPGGGETEGDGEGLGLEVGLVVGVEGVSGLGLVVGVEGDSGLGLTSGEEGLVGDPGEQSTERSLSSSKLPTKVLHSSGSPSNIFLEASMAPLHSSVTT